MMNQPGSKFEKPFPWLVQIPVVPGQLIVLAIGVVVSSLRTSYFIASAQASARLAIASASPENCASGVRAALLMAVIIGGPFDAHVP